MENLNKIEKFDIDIEVRNNLNKNVNNVEIELTRIDDFLYLKPNSFSAKTNEKGNVHLSNVLEGTYLLRASLGVIKKVGTGSESFKPFKEVGSNKIVIESLEEVNKSKTHITLKLPIIFGLFRKYKIFSEEDVSKVFERHRSDRENCFLCCRQYDSYLESYECAYCHKIYCSKHRLPENHKCFGEPTNPHRGGLREVHGANGSITAHGK